MLDVYGDCVFCSIFIDRHLAKTAAIDTINQIKLFPLNFDHSFYLFEFQCSGDITNRALVKPASVRPSQRYVFSFGLVWDEKEWEIFANAHSLQVSS